MIYCKLTGDLLFKKSDRGFIMQDCAKEAFFEKENGTLIPVLVSERSFEMINEPLLDNMFRGMRTGEEYKRFLDQNKNIIFEKK